MSCRIRDETAIYCQPGVYHIVMRQARLMLDDKGVNGTEPAMRLPRMSMFALLPRS